MSPAHCFSLGIVQVTLEFRRDTCVPSIHEALNRQSCRYENKAECRLSRLPCRRHTAVGEECHRGKRLGD